MTVSSSTTTKAHGRSSSKSSLRASIQERIQHTIDYNKMPPIYKIPLYELNCGFGIVKKKHSDPVLLKDCIRHERKQQQADVTVLFAIRQAGWGACREHGLQLVELAAHQDRQVALLATTKETGLDDAGLLEFYQDYFNSFPIYKDEKWDLYKAMGGKTIGLFGLLKGILKARTRLLSKKIASSKTNGQSKVAWMTGGVLVFDKAGELVFVLEEKVGEEFDMEQIQLAIQEARFRNAAKATESSGTATSGSSGSGD